MPAEGTPNFNSIKLMELGELKFYEDGGPVLRARFAYVNTANGKTYGSATSNHFSKEVLEKLEELKQALELDFAKLVFVEHQEETRVAAPKGQPPPGLVEHLGDAHSI